MRDEVASLSYFRSLSVLTIMRLVGAISLLICPRLSGLEAGFMSESELLISIY